MFVRTVDPDKVALWDVDAAHPGGELYLAGNPDVTHEVADTAGVRAAIRQGKLIEVEAPEVAPDSVPDDQPPSDGQPPTDTSGPVLTDTASDPPVADAKPATKKRGS